MVGRGGVGLRRQVLVLLKSVKTVVFYLSLILCNLVLSPPRASVFVPREWVFPGPSSRTKKIATGSFVRCPVSSNYSACPFQLQQYHHGGRPYCLMTRPEPKKRIRDACLSGRQKATAADGEGGWKPRQQAPINLV